MSPLPATVHLGSHLRIALTGGASLAGAIAMLAWRVREASAPVTARRIVAPPLGMSTGLAMFAFQEARVPWSWAAVAFVLGATVLALPVVHTSRLVRSGAQIRMERSRAFLAVLVGLVAVRLAARASVEHLASPMQTAGLFFLLAFGMIVRWRTGMLLQYRRLTAARPAGVGPGDRSLT